MPKESMSFSAPDDNAVYVIRRDVSGGGNSRQHGSMIDDNQCESLQNADITIMGKSVKRKGNKLIEDLGDDAGTGAYGFKPDGGSAEIIVTHGAKLEGCTSPAETGAGGQFSEHKTDFTSGLRTKMCKAIEQGEGDVLIISNGTDNMFRMLQAHTFQDLGSTSGTGTDSPPKSTVFTFFRNRLWVMKSNKLYWSTALGTDGSAGDYSQAFDTVTDWFSVPCGTERSLIGLRDIGMICVGSDSVWGINPSSTPAATDGVEKLLDIGCIANESACQVGDDVFFLAPDGVRGVFRTQQDKLQLGQSFPLSYALKDDYDNINWAYVYKACATWFDNKYLIALPVLVTDSSPTYNNQVWVYYPSTQAWTVFTGWSVAAWCKVTISGEERLYYISSTDGSVYRAFATSDTDSGTAITYTETGRKEDMGYPMVRKVGGEVTIKAEASGSNGIVVSIQFDDEGFNTLGTLDASGNLVTFPVSFPVNFGTPSVCFDKFHLDQYGSWYQCQLKLTDSTESDCIILERHITSYLEEYIPEESA